jgi:cell division septal protein FtsQ
MKQRTTSTGNQRLSTSRQRKQQHLLDVKVRSYKFKQQRNRKVVNALFKMILLASLAGAVWYGGRECLNRFLWRNPDYILTTVEISDDGTLSREQIQDTAHIHEGGNIFLVNLSKARDSLSLLPQVERVELERTLPGKITITIAERKPIAWLTAKEADDPTTSPDAFLIDRKGTLIKTKKQLREYFHMPVIFGFATDNLEAGQTLNAPEIRAALNLIDLNADNARFQIRSIDLSKGYCMVVTNQSHMLITFGLDHVDTQLERLGWALDYVEKNNKILQTANFMVERNTPVTYVQPADDAGGETPEAPAVAATPKITPPPPVKKPEPVKPNNKPRKTPVPVRRALPVTY